MNTERRLHKGTHVRQKSVNEHSHLETITLDILKYWPVDTPFFFGKITYWRKVTG